MLRVASVVALLSVSLSFMSSDANGAACSRPLGDRVSSSGGVTTLHSFEEGAELCIHAFTPENACARCESGYFHQCKSGWWRPLKWKPCKEEEAFSAESKPPTRKEKPTADDQVEQQRRHKANQKLCKILKTC